MQSDEFAISAKRFARRTAYVLFVLYRHALGITLFTHWFHNSGMLWVIAILIFVIGFVIDPRYLEPASEGEFNEFLWYINN
jgi:hypothetical protein